VCGMPSGWNLRITSDENHSTMRVEPQKHRRCTTLGPNSSKSPREIQRPSRFLSEATTDPPIHAAYCRPGGAMMVTLEDGAARALISFCKRSGSPGKREVPPETTMFRKRFGMRSGSHFMIALMTCSWMPAVSSPKSFGWNRASGHRNRSEDRQIVCPLSSMLRDIKLGSRFVSCSKSSAT